MGDGKHDATTAGADAKDMTVSRCPGVVSSTDVRARALEVRRSAINQVTHGVLRCREAGSGQVCRLRMMDDRVAACREVNRAKPVPLT